jgi:hypothetical protein
MLLFVLQLPQTALTFILRTAVITVRTIAISLLAT